MPADTVTIAGHRCERGSEAERLLLGSASAERVGFNAVAHELYRQARRAPGYLGPANVETTDAR